jgi:4-hydroxy-2-oxoheptanedioate aldolase
MAVSDNPFKNALRAGKKQIGLWLSLPEPYTAEICAASNFDWLLIDAEHAPNDVRSILAQLQAIAPYPAHAVVRVPSDDPVFLKLVLDIGVTSLLVPMVSTAQQARALVEAVRYPPNGHRGIGHVLGRASRWGRKVNYFKNWEQECCLLIQLESVEALANLEEIVAVDGFDGVLMGPADLAASLGHPGDLAHPNVQAAMDDAIRRLIAAGSVAGVLCVGEDPAVSYFDKGCTFVAAGVDVLLLTQAADALAHGVRNRLTTMHTGGPA